MGRQIYEGPFYADSIAARYQMRVGQEGPSVVAAFRRPAGRFLSGLGASSLSDLERYKVTGTWSMPVSGVMLSGVVIAPLAAGELPGPASAAAWALAACARGAVVFSDAGTSMPTGNHLLESADARLIELLRSGVRLFGGAPMTEVPCMPAPGPLTPVEPPPAPASRTTTLLVVAGALIATAAGYYLLRRAKQP